MKHQSILILSLLWISLGACAQPPLSENAADQNHARHELTGAKQSVARPYRKPGAAIDFTSDYRGSSTLGEVDTIEFSFTSVHAGLLVVSLRSKDLVMTAGDVEQSQVVEAGETVRIPVDVLMSAAGKYYINMLATIEIEGKRSARAFALPLYAGDWAAAKNRQQKALPSEGNVIIMQALESLK